MALLCWIYWKFIYVFSTVICSFTGTSALECCFKLIIGVILCFSSCSALIVWIGLFRYLIGEITNISMVFGFWSSFCTWNSGMSISNLLFHLKYLWNIENSMAASTLFIFYQTSKIKLIHFHAFYANFWKQKFRYEYEKN